MKDAKRIYSALSTANKKGVRSYVAGRVGVSDKTFSNHLETGLDVIESKHFREWFEQQGIPLLTLVEFQPNAAYPIPPNEAA